MPVSPCAASRSLRSRGSNSVFQSPTSRPLYAFELLCGLVSVSKTTSGSNIAQTTERWPYEEKAYLKNYNKKVKVASERERKSAEGWILSIWQRRLANYLL